MQNFATCNASSQVSTPLFLFHHEPGTNSSSMPLAARRGAMTALLLALAVPAAAQTVRFLAPQARRHGSVAACACSCVLYATAGAPTLGALTHSVCGPHERVQDGSRLWVDEERPVLLRSGSDCGEAVRGAAGVRAAGTGREGRRPATGPPRRCRAAPRAGQPGAPGALTRLRACACAHAG